MCGRCIPEILRTIEALQIADKNNASLPANWVNGNPLIQSSPQNFEELINRIAEIKENRNGLSWYLSFKENDIQSANNEEKR